MELVKFIKRLLTPGWLPFATSGRVRITGSKILKIVHTRTRSVEYHGLIQIKPASRVKSVIERINQSRINGRLLHSHAYSKRITRSDRRKRLFAEQGHSYERRELDRRRKHLVSQVVDVSL